MAESQETVSLSLKYCHASFAFTFAKYRASSVGSPKYNKASLYAFIDSFILEF